MATQFTESRLSGALQSFLVAVVTVYSPYKHSDYRHKSEKKKSSQVTGGGGGLLIEPLPFQLDMWVSTSVALTFMPLWSVATSGGTASARPRTLRKRNVSCVNGSRITCLGYGGLMSSLEPTPRFTTGGGNKRNKGELAASRRTTRRTDIRHKTAQDEEKHRAASLSPCVLACLWAAQIFFLGRCEIFHTVQP